MHSSPPIIMLFLSLTLDLRANISPSQICGMRSAAHFGACWDDSWMSCAWQRLAPGEHPSLSTPSERVGACVPLWAQAYGCWSFIHGPAGAGRWGPGRPDQEQTLKVPWCRVCYLRMVDSSFPPPLAGFDPLSEKPSPMKWLSRKNWGWTGWSAWKVLEINGPQTWLHIVIP